MLEFRFFLRDANSGEPPKLTHGVPDQYKCLPTGVGSMASQRLKRLVSFPFRVPNFPNGFDGEDDGEDGDGDYG